MQGDLLSLTIPVVIYPQYFSAALKKNVNNSHSRDRTTTAYCGSVEHFFEPHIDLPVKSVFDILHVKNIIIKNKSDHKLRKYTIH